MHGTERDAEGVRDGGPQVAGEIALAGDRETVLVGFADGESPLEAAAAEDEINVRDLLRALWRRKMLLGACVLVITSLVYWYVQSMTPIYLGEALLRVYPPVATDSGRPRGPIPERRHQACHIPSR